MVTNFIKMDKNYVIDGCMKYYPKDLKKIKEKTIGVRFFELNIRYAGLLNSYILTRWKKGSSSEVDFVYLTYDFISILQELFFITKSNIATFTPMKITEFSKESTMSILEKYCDKDVSFLLLRVGVMIGKLFDTLHGETNSSVDYEKRMGLLINIATYLNILILKHVEGNDFLSTLSKEDWLVQHQSVMNDNVDEKEDSEVGDNPSHTFCDNIAQEYAKFIIGEKNQVPTTEMVVEEESKKAEEEFDESKKDEKV